MARINHEIGQYHSQVERAKQYIALRAEGFETNSPAPKGEMVVFALPAGGTAMGREIDDMMGGTYPVMADAAQTPVQSYLGWKRIF